MQRVTTVMAAMLLCALMGLPTVGSLSAPVVQDNPADLTGDARRADLLARVARGIDQHIIPGFTRLSQATDGLVEAVEAHCSALDIASLRRLEAEFADAVTAWSAVQHLRFGPLRDQGRVAQIHFWPDPRAVRERQLRAIFRNHDAALLDPAVLRQQSVAVLGLGALDYYIVAERKAFAKSGKKPAGDFECLYARGVAQQLNGLASETLSAWTASDGWRHRLLNPGPASEIYRSADESAAQLIKAVLIGLQLVREQRIVPLYLFAKGEKRRARLPFQRLGLAGHSIQASINALRELSISLAFDDFGRGQTAWIKAWTEQSFTTLAKSAQKLTVPDRSRLRVDDFDLGLLRRMRFFTNGLRQVIARQTAPSAGLTIGFNELDGD